MTDAMRGALYGALATLSVAAFAGFLAWKQYQLQAEQLAFQKQQAAEITQQRDLARRESEAFKRGFDQAPAKFVQRFGALINNAAAETARTQGKSSLIPHSRAIVAHRDAVRVELRGLAKLLNSDIDRLAAQLAKPKPDQRKVADALDKLRAKWTFKEDEISLQLKRLMLVLEFVSEPDQAAPLK